MIKYNLELQIYYSTLIASPRVYAGFGTRETGDGRTMAHIARLFKESKVPQDKVVSLEQIHSANIAVFTKDTALPHEVIEETDGVITQAKKAALIVLTADCVPIVYHDLKLGLVGISHQGWRGSLHNLPSKMIAKFEFMGSKRGDIVAAIGPSIGDCCYNVDEDRRLEFLDAMDEKIVERVFAHRGGKWHLNLTLLNFLLLKGSGLQKDQIDFFPFCTSCNREKFFSLRRKQVRHHDFERQFNFIIKT